MAAGGGFIVNNPWSSSRAGTATRRPGSFRSGRLACASSRDGAAQGGRSARCRSPLSPFPYVKGNDQRFGRQRHGDVLRVLAPERRDGPAMLGPPLQQPYRAFEQNEPEPAPVLLIVIDQDSGPRIGAEVAHSA